MPENNTNIIKHTITRLLARREHSKAELLKKLLARGFESELSTVWIEKFSGNNIQSEYRFTESFIRSKVTKGLGEARIRNELREHNVDSHLVNQIFREMAVDWYEQARAVFEKRYSGGLEMDYKARQKQQRFMYYRGFNQEQINFVFTCYQK